MFNPLVRQFATELSGQRAHRIVDEITRYHRIQASPGFRAAATWCLERLLSAGVEAELLEYAADLDTNYWSLPGFQEWEAEEAELWLIEPSGERRRLCDYQEKKLSLVQRSPSTQPEGVEAELLVLDKAEDEESYHGIDVSGKVLLVRGDLRRIHKLAVDKYGALGLVTDPMMEQPPVRERSDLPDALQYASFHWNSANPKGFGFVVSPRVGAMLREKAKKLSQEKPARCLRVWARVRSRFYDGQFENVTAVIPGQSPEEVLVIAHLCHPQPSANDNASGAATAMEVAITLARLVREGKLPHPKRTIRFLWVPEMTGTFAYLSSRPGGAPKIIAAVNLDMVGENQDLSKSTLCVEKPPRACPSFTGDLMARILQATATDPKLDDNTPSLGSTTAYAHFRWAVTPFAGGSDHYVLSDPTVGIPCPMVIQWPDKYYHTSEDTPDKVDPRMLHRVSILTATYTWFLATAGYPEAVWLAGEMAAGFGAEIHSKVQELLRQGMEKARAAASSPGSPGLALAEMVSAIRGQLTFLLERKRADLRSIGSLLGASEQEFFDLILDHLDQELFDQVNHEECRLRLVLRGVRASLGDCSSPELAPRQLDEWEAQAASMFPRRIHPGPIMWNWYLPRLHESQAAEFKALSQKHRRTNIGTLLNLLDYWIDGKRNLLQVVDLVELESGVRDPHLAVLYVRALEDLGLAEVAAAT